MPDFCLTVYWQLKIPRKLSMLRKESEHNGGRKSNIISKTHLRSHKHAITTNVLSMDKMIWIGSNHNFICSAAIKQKDEQKLTICNCSTYMEHIEVPWPNALLSNRASTELLVWWTQVKQLHLYEMQSRMGWYNQTPNLISTSAVTHFKCQTSSS